MNNFLARHLETLGGPKPKGWTGDVKASKRSPAAPALPQGGGLPVFEKRVQLKESLKQQEIDAFKSYKDKIDTEDYKRQLEKKEREERIKRLINRTTNVTVEQQASKAELEIDRKVREAQEQREQFEKMLQEKKRDDQRRH